MKDLVTGHPYTTETVIQPEVDEFIIIACDGVSPSVRHFFLPVVALLC
jgi:protein phosphatase PTC1